MTQLIEFNNRQGETLRGLFDKAKSTRGIIFVHGFERTTIESKFKNIIDKLKGKINFFRFDFSGCGLSDGNFKNLTLKKQVQELKEATEKFLKISKVKSLSFVAHSFGCVVVLEYLKSARIKIDKIVLISPALNQKMLHRFWFTKNYKKDNEINWSNFKEHFKGIKGIFEKEMKNPLKMTKEHIISSAYFLENKDRDYQELFTLPGLNSSQFLIIHGENDDKVPIESNDQLPSQIKKIIIADGDHDLQRPDMVKQYLDKLIKFLNS